MRETAIDRREEKERESGRTGRSAQKPKCRRRVLLHRAGYKSPGYKRAYSRNRPELVTSTRCARPPVCSCSCSCSRTVHDRMNELAACFFFFSVHEKVRSRHHEVVDLNDRTYGRRRYALVAELRMPVTAHGLRDF